MGFFQERGTLMDKVDPVGSRVKKCVITALQLDIPYAELPDSEPLFGDLGADSIASLQIVEAIEREFGIRVEDEELRSELFDSVQSLCEFVNSKTAPSFSLTDAGSPQQSAEPK